jgi:L-Ala-D/L-Glu epimerase
MKILRVDAFVIRLPFRFSFGHSIASRAYSDNLIVRIELEDGSIGYGEGIPREYVTGETIDGALADVGTFAAKLRGQEATDFPAVKQLLHELASVEGLEHRRAGAAFCAVELALLDAFGNCFKTPVAIELGDIQHEYVQYGSVIPFGNKKVMVALLWFYKLWGFKTVKLKVGGTLEDDLTKLKLVRQIMGPEAIIRVDANCAWDVDQTLLAADKFQMFNVASIEQPIKADNINGLAKIVANVGQEIVVDESLCTMADAKDLIEAKACTAFNIRISKVGGLLLAKRMAELARNSGLSVHMGAQVGESAILTAAGRIFAATEPACKNYEGSNNSWLLQQDISRENLTVSLRGKGNIKLADGLGLNILESRVAGLTRKQMPDAHATDKVSLTK